jgi:ketosteroid isomerase-like protein
MPRGGVGLYPSRAVPPEPRRSDVEGHGDLTEAREIITEDVGRRTTGTFPGLERVYRGPNALDDWMEAFRAEWREFNVSLAEVLAENDDAIVVVERLWGRGRESGAEVEMRTYAVYRFNVEGSRPCERPSEPRTRGWPRSSGSCDHRNHE